MLKELSIRDFKLLRDVTLTFSDGMTVLTGETGAGKTQCLEALVAAMGARSGDDSISKKAQKAVLTAIFDIGHRPDVAKSLVKAGFLEDDETELILERTIVRCGRSQGRLNGRRVPIGTLQTVAGSLVDLLGQNARADILNRPALEILDTLGDDSHASRLAKVKQLHTDWKAAGRTYETEKAEIEKVKERRELVEFQHAELEKADIKAGEEVKLTRENELLETAKDRLEDSLKAASLLSGNDDETTGARDHLQEALDLLNNLMASDLALKGEYLRLREMVYLSEELADTLRRYAENIVDDPERRSYVEARLGVIHQLKRKYKTDEDGLISLRSKLTEELEKVTGASDRLKGLAKKRDFAREKYLKDAVALSKARSKLAKKISKEVKNHLADLDLPNATFTAKLDSELENPKNFRADGIDRAVLLIATNPAQEPAPLKKVASGGELSRLLIALKTVLANRDRVPVLVFDEAEAGIGGETAFRVGEKLVELSGSHQLILVSHLPQIASQGRGHWVIEKSMDKKDTRASAREVTGDARVEEIGRMLGARGDRAALERLARSFLEELPRKSTVSP